LQPVNAVGDEPLALGGSLLLGVLNARWHPTGVRVSLLDGSDRVRGLLGGRANGAVVGQSTSGMLGEMVVGPNLPFFRAVGLALVALADTNLCIATIGSG